MASTIVDTKVTGLGPDGLIAPRTNIRADLPVTFRTEQYTYYDGSGYTNTASRICALNTSNNYNSIVKGTYYKKGDFNYASQVSALDFVFCAWGPSPTVYELRAKGKDLADSSVHVWVDSSHYLWVWNNQQWEQESWVVFEYIDGDVVIDCDTIDATMHAWTGQSRYNVAPQGLHQREAAWGD